MCALAVSMRHACQTAVHTVVVMMMMPSFWSWKGQIIKRRTAIEDYFKSNDTNKHGEPGARVKKNYYFLYEPKLLKCRCSEGQTETWQEVSTVPQSGCEWALSPVAAVLWSRILSFYRILMSLLPPPLFTTDKEWNWSVRCAAALALSSGHRHQELRWEKAIKLYTVYFNWALNPFLLRSRKGNGKGKSHFSESKKEGEKRLSFGSEVERFTLKRELIYLSGENFVPVLKI